MNFRGPSLDPPEEDTTYALKCKKCGRFVKMTPKKHESVKISETDLDGKVYSYRESWAIFECSKCGEIPEGMTRNVCA